MLFFLWLVACFCIKANHLCVFRSRVTNQSKWSLVNRKLGLHAIFRKAFDWGGHCKRFSLTLLWKAEWASLVQFEISTWLLICKIITFFLPFAVEFHVCMYGKYNMIAPSGYVKHCSPDIPHKVQSKDTFRQTDFCIKSHSFSLLSWWTKRPLD